MKLLLVTILFVSCLLSKAQYPHDINFKGYHGDDKLVGRQVWQMFIDSRGLLWMSTTNGLDRFDGVNLKEYRYKEGDSTSLLHNFCMYMVEDAQGRLWVSTLKGICYYDLNTDKFTALPQSTYTGLKDMPTYLCLDKNKRLWFGEDHLLVAIDTKTMQVKRYSLYERADSVYTNDGSAILESHNGKLWVAANAGLYYFDPSNGTSEYFSLGNTRIKPGNVGSVINMMEDDGFLWMASWNTGLSRLDIKKRVLKKYNTQTEPYSAIDVERVTGDTMNRYMWVGTKRLGLGVFDRKEERFVRFFRSEDKREGGLSFNNCSTILEDKNGILWVGTEKGVNTYDRNSQKITSVRPHQFFPYIDWTHSMRFFIPSKKEDGTGLFFTHGDGYYRYDFTKGKVLQSFRKSRDLLDLQEDFIDWAFRDSRGRTWCATHAKMKWLDDNGNEYRSFKSVWLDNKEIPVMFDYGGIESFDHRIWKVSVEGLSVFNEAKQRFELAFQDIRDSLLLGHMNGIVQAPDSTIWLCGWTDGVRIFDMNKKTVRHIPSFEDKQKQKKSGLIAHIAVAGDIVWLADNTLVWRYNRRTKETTSYNELDGIADNQVTGIATDKSGRLWVSTYRGVSAWDEKQQKFISFGIKQGMAEELVHSLFLLEDGRLLASGIGCYSIIDPSNIKLNRNQYPLIITSFKVNEKEMIHGDTNGMIRLDHDQNVLSFDYRLLNYSNSVENTYRYQLEGFDKTWVNAGTRTSAFYTNLPSGTYTFKVMGANNDGVWSESTAEISIHIATPWWQTWWFRGLIIAAVTCLVYYLYRLRLQKALAIERTRLRIARDLHDNVGSALSSIYIMNSVAAKKVDSDPETAKRMSEKAGSTSLDMMNTMSDIIWSINPVNDNMQQMIHRMREFATNTLEAKGINCRFTSDKKIDETKLSMEVRHDLYLVFKEIVNNAAKYSAARNCYIDLLLEDGLIHLKIEDDGNGFDPSKSSIGNGLHNIKKRCESMGAHYRLTTDEGLGTSWNIIMEKHVKMG